MDTDTDEVNLGPESKMAHLAKCIEAADREAYIKNKHVEPVMREAMAKGAAKREVDAVKLERDAFKRGRAAAKIAHVKLEAEVEAESKAEQGRIELDQMKCEACQQGSARKLCNMCRPGMRARYCNIECQQADWQSHKILCPRTDNDAVTRESAKATLRASGIDPDGIVGLETLGGVEDMIHSSHCQRFNPHKCRRLCASLVGGAASGNWCLWRNASTTGPPMRVLTDPATKRAIHIFVNNMNAARRKRQRF
jgi:hypothetical protein